jgi:Tol biopolymer transport system component
MNHCRVLVIAYLLLLLSACGGTTPTPAPPTLTQPPVPVSPTETTAPPVATAAPEEPAASPTPTTRPPTPTPSPEPTPTGPRASVQDLINQVDAHPLPAGDWQRAEIAMAIYVGGEVWAQEASTARVGVPNGLVRVAPNTIFSFGQPAPDTVTLGLLEGQIWLNIEGLGAGQTFQVETPNAVAAIRDTRFSVRADPVAGTFVSTQVGTVTLSAEGETVAVRAGQLGAAQPGDPPADPIPMPPAEQVRWGMAAGAELEVALPAVHLTQTVVVTGELFNPQLSPDGRLLSGYYYYGNQPGQYGSLFLDLGSGAPLPGVIPPDASGIAFSPDGTLLAYWQFFEGNGRFCIVPVTGGEPTCVGGTAYYYGWPFWSPDGQWIMFYMQPEEPGAAFNLYRVRPDGSDLTPLTTGDEFDKRSPEWSPDGALIAFTARATGAGSGPGDLWVMDADGGDPRLLMQGIYLANHPIWKPDGSLVAVSGAEDSLWLVPIDGSAPNQVPDTAGWSCASPSWARNDDGWPLLFYQSPPDDSTTVLSYVPGPDGVPQPLLEGTAWGPLWSADEGTIAFGVMDLEGEIPMTTVLIYQAVADFYR